MKKFVIVAAACFLLIGPGACRLQDNHANTGSIAAGTGLSMREGGMWGGVYTGTVRRADGKDVRIQLVLNYDGTYELLQRKMGHEGRDTVALGNFGWNEAGNTVIFDRNDISPYWLVGEGMMLQLDGTGKSIASAAGGYSALVRRPFLTLMSRLAPPRPIIE